MYNRLYVGKNENINYSTQMQLSLEARQEEIKIVII
jgi:hypothetical protein